jgi:hypothetical protein
MVSRTPFQFFLVGCTPTGHITQDLKTWDKSFKILRGSDSNRYRIPVFGYLSASGGLPGPHKGRDRKARLRWTRECPVSNTIGPSYLVDIQRLSSENGVFSAMNPKLGWMQSFQ